MFLILASLALATPPPVTPPATPAVKAEPRAPVEARPMTELAPFTEMALALKDRDIPRFQAAWHPQGWSDNLVGPSGLSGESVARQAKSDGWVLRPENETLAKHAEGEAWMVRCRVEDREGKAVDSVYAVVIPYEGRHVVLGAGENPEQAMALASRFVASEPLAPAEP